MAYRTRRALKQALVEAETRLYLEMNYAQKLEERLKLRRKKWRGGGSRPGFGE